MSRLLSKLIDSLSHLFNVAKYHENRDQKNQLKVLRNLFINIKDIYRIVDLYSFIYENGDILLRSNDIRIDNCNKYSSEISKLLETVPNASVGTHLSTIKIMYINCNRNSVEATIRNDKARMYKPLIANLDEIVEFYNSVNISGGFSGLLNKYEDTFITLNSTIIELKEGSIIHDNHKETVRAIVQTFIDEFNSLKQVYGVRENLDKKATKESITKRLEDELEFVKRIKTDWNSSAL